MSYEPSVLSGHQVGELNRSYAGAGNPSYSNPIVNGGPVSRPNEDEKKRNFKLLIDPVLKGRGHQKIYRFDGHFEGQAPVVPKDPRSRRTRLWSTRSKADLPVPKFKIDKFYVGIPPQRDIILNGLNDNVDRKFLHQICEKFGNIEGIKIFYDPLTKRHLGKARVGFTTSASAKLAVAKLEGTSIMGCIVQADLEHKVEIKPPSKTLAGPQVTNSVTKTSPSTERTTTHHVLPTPPPSASSQSPINTTPSTPGSLGLMDPRTRGHSTSSVGTEKSPPQALQSSQSDHKVPVFEPISPPCERIKLPPPPPPDAPPPTTQAKRYSPIPPTQGDRHQETLTKQGKESKGSHSKTSRDSYRNNRQSEKDFDWRRRDRDSSRDRRDYSSSRSRWDERGSSYYTEKESRYSSHKDYSSRGRSGGESRNGYGKNDNRKSSSRDNDNKRRRDSDESCSSEKSGKSWKPINESSSGGVTESTDVKDGRTKVGSSEKPKESAVSSISVEPPSKGISSLNASLGEESSKLHGSPLSISVNPPQMLSTSHNTTAENGDHGQSHSSSDCLVKQKLEEEGSSNVLKEHGSVGGNSDHGINRVNAENMSKSIAADATNPSDLLGGLAEQALKPKSGSGNLQKGDIGYYPEVEDISPVSSPSGAKTPTTTYETAVPNASTITSDGQLELSEELPVDKNDQGVTEDDDAMSLSSISSNEETLEVAKPERVPPITVPPPTIPFPPFVPPPFIPPFDPTVPPPSMAPLSILPPPLPIAVPPPPIQNLAPPHPLVPPSFHPTYPPQFASTITGVPPLPVQPQYQPYTSGHLPPSHEQRPTQKKTWKAKISEECLRIVSKELELILKRDVNKRLVENSAFKALDCWWDNLGKTKLKLTVTQQPPAPVVSQSPLLSPVNQTDMTSSPLFSTSMNQSGGLGIGLRASLPKMPSFRKRPPPSTSGSELYAKRKREDSSYDADTKGNRAENELEVSGQQDSINSYQGKREETGDSIYGPPAMSVRIEEKHPTPGSSLYTNIYSSFSESGSSVVGDESESGSSREEESDWDDSEESDLSSQSASEFSSDEDDETKRSGVQMLEMVSGIPRTPPGTPPETPPESPRAPRTPSITPPASPVDSQLATTEESEGPKVEGVKAEVNDGDMWSAGTIQEDRMKTVDLMDYSSSEPEKSDMTQEFVTASEGFNKEALNESMTDDTVDHILQKVEPKSEEPTLPILHDSDSTQSVAQELTSPISEKTESQETSVTTDTIPVFEMPPEFPPRPYIEDDQLVFDFLVSGLDYEDASYLKIGFERLAQVGSDSIADAQWAFHPATSAGIPTKGRKQKSDNCGVRLHKSGSARCEGYYKLSMAEKAKYLEAARRQLDRTQAVDNKKIEEKEANKAKQQSRENRVLQRRLAASFQNEDFGDILKFNQLKVRKKKLTFCKSCIHDWGLFALEPIGPDEMVIEYVGEVVRQTIADHREKFYERVGIGSSYLFRVDTDTIIDATKYGNLARFINHCCEPNCYAKVVTLESEKKIVIYSKRDIAVNEEITYDYKFPIEDDKIPCLCGAAQCRGTLN